MRYSSYPIVFLKQNESGLKIKVNGYNAGYDTLIFYKDGDKTNYKSIGLTSDEIFIAAKKFSSGKGNYCFYLKKESLRTPVYTTYISCNKKEDDFKRILESIINPEDSIYMLKKTNAVPKESKSYTKDLALLYRKTENKQDSEVRNFCRLISAAEKYENDLTVFMNNINVSPINYDRNYELTPNDIVTSIKIYSIEDDEKTLIAIFSPHSTERIVFDYDKLYTIELLADSETFLELVHYEPDKQGSDYLWSLDKNNVDNIKHIDKIFFEFAHDDIDPENARRIVQEKKKENIDAFMPRLVVKQSLYHDAVLEIEIPDYELLESMQKDFYISIREPDQLFDKTFSKRYKITSNKMMLNTQTELLSGEIILFIEDGNQVVVSSFTRIDLEDAVGFGEMQEYVAKRNMVEVKEYIDSYIEHLRPIVADGEYLSNLSNIMKAQSHDSDVTPEKIFYNTLIKATTSSLLNKYVDNLLYFTFTDWTGRHNIDQKFFKSKPRFVNARDTFIFPTSEEIYSLVLEKITIEENLEAKIEKTFYASSPNRSISINIAKGDMFLIYAIDSKTYKRSGALLINNVGKKEYFKNQLELEALSND